MTALIMIQCLIVLLLFLIYDRVNKNNKEQPSHPHQELDVFRQGARQNWITVNVCLYKMWTELEILDYDSLQGKLQETIQELTDNPQKLEEWGKKFNKYIKEQEGPNGL